MRHNLVIVAIAAFGHPQLAGAQPTGAQAETLFNQGIAFMDAGKIADACTAFDASEKLEPGVATLLNQADCREKNHQLATAWGLFLDAERQTRAATDQPTQQLHQVAVDHAAKLEPRLSKLTIKIPAGVSVDGLEILRNADVVHIGAWNQPLPIDGGHYTISARAPRYDSWSTTIDIGVEGDAKSVDIVRLKVSPVAVRSKLPYVLGGAGVVLLGTAIGFELIAESTYNSSKVEPNEPKQLSLWHTANAQRYTAEGLAVGGLACAGLAVWRYLRHGTVMESPTQVSIVPLVGGDQAGLVLVGRY